LFSVFSQKFKLLVVTVFPPESRDSTHNQPFEL